MSRQSQTGVVCVNVAARAIEQDHGISGLRKSLREEPRSFGVHDHENGIPLAPFGSLPMTGQR
jgi:hypothetical protein